MTQQDINIKSKKKRWWITRVSKPAVYDKEVARIYKNNKISGCKIAKQLNLTLGQVYWSLQRTGVKSRSLSESHVTVPCNYNFFNKINTEAKAYFLGFLYADGAIVRNSMAICLHKQDEHIIRDFKKILKSNHTIRKDRGYIRFAISNQKLVEDLKRVGCGERKSLTLRFPSRSMIPESLLRHFIRGIYDGDGCIGYYHKKEAWKWEIVSTYHVCEKIRIILLKYIDKNLTESKPYQEKRSGNGKIYYFKIGGARPERIEKIYNYLYKNSHFYLKRKRDKFLYIKKTLRKKYG